LMSYGHRYFGGLTTPTECSHPSLVRNIIADTFLRSPFEWLVGVDADIVAGPADFEMLLEEIDSDEHYVTPEEPVGSVERSLAPNRIPQPTRVLARLASHPVDSPTMIVQGECDALVNCEYAYKREPFEAVQFGLGFYRAHRSVFSVLQQLKHRDNGRVEVDRALLEQLLSGENQYPFKAGGLVHQIRQSITSQADQPRLWQVTHEGRVFHDYYPSGPIIDLHVPNGAWKGEDHGFWTLCHLAGLIPRIETRTRLIHLGRKGYPYGEPGTLALQ